MNYEEKYKQALERARIGLHDCNLLDCDDMTRKVAITTIYHLFPELIEDEDERIRKGIIRNLQYLMDRSEGFVKEDLQERIAWLEKQGEQPIDKIEPKFKVGDFIMNNDITEDGKPEIFKIIKVCSSWYDVENVYDGRQTIITFSQDYTCHLWTIDDAKDGDVLVDSYSKDSIIILYKGIYKERTILAHCGWNGYNLTVNTNGFGYGGLDNTNYLPATKEQCDLLFAKMKENGYEWNSEKKELKKIVVASKEGDDERIRKAIHIYLDWLDGRKDYQPKGVYTIRDMIDWVIKQDKKISADKVVAWLKPYNVVVGDIVELFKKDFGL